MDVDYSALSDQELSAMLKDYGVDVGPVNMATRKAYERKLHKLKTGEVMPAAPKYEPVADDDDDDVVNFKAPPATRQQTAPPPVPSYTTTSKTPEPPQTRLRREPGDSYSPLIDSRPSLNSARKTTLSYDTRRPDPPTANASPVKVVRQTGATSGGGLPMWVKLTALVAAVVLVYLIYSNMEANTASTIPKIHTSV